jgi:hypothetical protein
MKHKPEVKTPEKERNASLNTSLNTSPVKVDGREEACPCSGGAATPDHQCSAASLELQELEKAADTEPNIYKHPCHLCRNNEEFCHCGTCDTCEYKKTAVGLNTHIMNDHEPSEVINTFGEQWCRERLGVVGKSQDSAQERWHSGKWDKIIPFLTEQERNHM